MMSRPPTAHSRALELRAATANDAPAIGELLVEALGSKYRPAFGRKASRTVEALVRAEAAEPKPGYVAAVRDGAVVGAGHLTTAWNAFGQDWTGTVRTSAGTLRAAWASVALALLAHDPLSAGEGHIGEVGVARGLRGQGIGRAVMEYLEVCARGQGCTHLTLWVALDNAPARRLYDRLGYAPVRTRRWLFGRVLFRTPGLVLLRKEIAPECLDLRQTGINRTS